ncbi:flagellar basal body-associated protein FliL [Azotobacter chroococcum]|uniref:flagellar basal body-associated protein FliL n=1 Tax=Azotobacter chroococcum TaxID=353 RepID=UPI00103A4699|nr:flagellar basal body-associated protein FliL [Azotobacter chroococcum]TBW36849.1 flagellar basal body-associated protein FliL [Azotobacter chroococcum]
MSKTPPARGNGKAGWLLVILLVLVAAGGSAAGVYFLMDKGAHGTASTEAAAEPVTAPIFVPVAPFTVNLRGEQREERLLYVGLSLQVTDKASEEFLKQYMPQLRSRLLKLFAAQTAAELMTPGGKDQLSAKILEMLQQPMATPQPTLRVTDVLYTDFIVQ